MRRNPMIVALALATLPAVASVYTDSFDSINPAWTTDRYAPSLFESIADPTPRNDGNVLRLGVSDADSELNRPASYASSFYNTQGRQMNISAGPVWSVSAEVYIDSSWDPINGNSRRTGLWTRDSNPVENNSNYPIFSFLSDNGSFQIRAYDSQAGWHNLGTSAFNGFDSWNTVRIESTGSSFDYYLNDTYLWSDLTYSATGFEDLRTVYLQAYNFGAGDYEVYWDNLTVTPAPGSAALLVVGTFFCTRRKR
ncbi:MAG: hypothetical protein KC996_00745 [Phycisphaerales bacterium]|nr:hypothetical protein [Phycisphaerales bacterium]